MDAKDGVRAEAKSIPVRLGQCLLFSAGLEMEVALVGGWAPMEYCQQQVSKYYYNVYPQLAGIMNPTAKSHASTWERRVYMVVC